MASFFLESLDPIINEVIHDMEGLSRHPYGCRVVQRMVEHCIEPQKSSILDSIIIHHNSLVDDQYGNYVVQRSLSYGREQDREAIFETVSGGDNVVRLSMRKQASNVVEMMIKHGNECQRQQLVQEMLNDTCVDQRGTTQSAIIAMSMDAYANYVVKTAMDFTENSHQRDQLFGVLVSHLNELVSDGITFSIVVVNIATSTTHIFCNMVILFCDLSISRRKFPLQSKLSPVFIYISGKQKRHSDHNNKNQ